MAAQALRRYVSTPLDNLGCLATSVHLQRWPRRYGGYVPATSAAKDVMLQGRIAFFDHDLVGFGALPFFWRRTVLKLPAMIYRASEFVWA